MFNLLPKRNNNQYVTREDLNSLIKQINKIKKGDKGADAYVSEALINALIKEVKPTKEQLQQMITPLIPEPLKGEKGEDGKHGDDLSAEVLMSKIKSIKGDERLLIDNIRGGKKIIGKMIELEKATNGLNSNFGYLNEYTEEIRKEMLDRVEGVEIAINNNGKDTHASGAGLAGTVFTITLNDGTELVTDLASLAGGGFTLSSTDGSVSITNVGSNYDLSVSADTNTYAVSGILVNGNDDIRITMNDATTFDIPVDALTQLAIEVPYDNTVSGLTATNVQAAIDEVLNTIPGSQTIVSTDAGNDITSGADLGAFFEETDTTVTNTVVGNKIADYTSEDATVTPINETITSLSFTSPNLTYTKEDGTTNVIDLSAIGADIDWSSVTDWDSFVSSVVANWSTANWDTFTSEFFSQLSSTEIDTFINQWDSDNFGTFIDQWVANTSATDWNTFIDAFITNVDSDDVTNFLDKLTGNKGDILVNSGTGWVKLPVGTDGQVLSPLASEATGLVWKNDGFNGLSAGNTIIPFNSIYESNNTLNQFFTEDSDAIYVVSRGGGSVSKRVFKYLKDTLTGEVVASDGSTVSAYSADFFVSESITMDDTYIYVPLRVNTIGSLYSTSIRIYDKATMTLQATHATDMTASTGINTYIYFGDELYIGNATNAEYKKYTISTGSISAGTVIGVGSAVVANGEHSIELNDKLHVFTTTSASIRIYTLSGSNFTLESTFTPTFPGVQFNAVSTTEPSPIAGCSSFSTNGVFNIGYNQEAEKEQGTGDRSTNSLIIKRYSLQ